MACKWCESDNQKAFTGEIVLHFPGLKNVDKPIVWVFPKVTVCMDCGSADFVVPEGERQLLAAGDAKAN